jgi:hypothetical protein
VLAGLMLALTRAATIPITIWWAIAVTKRWASVVVVAETSTKRGTLWFVVGDVDADLALEEGLAIEGHGGLERFEIFKLDVAIALGLVVVLVDEADVEDLALLGAKELAEILFGGGKGQIADEGREWGLLREHRRLALAGLTRLARFATLEIAVTRGVIAVARAVTIFSRRTISITITIVFSRAV